MEVAMFDLKDVPEEPFIERHILDAQTYRRFSKHNPLHWLAVVFVEWTIIGVTIWACNKWPYWWLWVAGILLIGTRQHALGILAHEGVHYIVTGKKRWNDLLANLLTAYPLTYCVEGYRTFHLLHHRWLETPRDPERATLDLYPDEWNYPMSRGRFYGFLVRDIFGLHRRAATDFMKYIWQVPGGNKSQIARVLIFHGVVLTIAVLSGYYWSYLLLWIVPLLTVTMMCVRMRTAAEHYGIGSLEQKYQRDAVQALPTTRTIIGNPLTRFLFCPHNMSYHVEHHLYPSVPVFRLRALHKELLKDRDFASHARITKGYARLVDELTT
jgi:fatty acid desaturase